MHHFTPYFMFNLNFIFLDSNTYFCCYTDALEYLGIFWCNDIDCIFNAIQILDVDNSNFGCIILIGILQFPNNKIEINLIQSRHYFHCKLFSLQSRMIILVMLDLANNEQIVQQKEVNTTNWAITIWIQFD